MHTRADSVTPSDMSHWNVSQDPGSKNPGTVVLMKSSDCCVSVCELIVMIRLCGSSDKAFCVVDAFTKA